MLLWTLLWFVAADVEVWFRLRGSLLAPSKPLVLDVHQLQPEEEARRWSSSCCGACLSWHEPWHCSPPESPKGDVFGYPVVAQLDGLGLFEHPRSRQLAAAPLWDRIALCCLCCSRSAGGGGGEAAGFELQNVCHLLTQLPSPSGVVFTTRCGGSHTSRWLLPSSATTLPTCSRP